MDESEYGGYQKSCMSLSTLSLGNEGMILNPKHNSTVVY